MKNALERTLAKRLRAVTAARELPLSHLADRAGVSRSHIWSVMSAKRSATLGMVQRLAAVLEVEPLELLYDPDGAPARRRGRTSG